MFIAVVHVIIIDSRGVRGVARHGQARSPFSTSRFRYFACDIGPPPLSFEKNSDHLECPFKDKDERHVARTVALVSRIAGAVHAAGSATAQYHKHDTCTTAEPGSLRRLIRRK
jgi:hypothetical protein